MKVDDVKKLLDSTRGLCCLGQDAYSCIVTRPEPRDWCTHCQIIKLRDTVHELLKE